MIVQYTGFGYLDYRDIEENIAFRSIAIRKVYDKLFEIDIMSDHFGLRSTYVLIYDTDMNTIEGFSYGIYPGFILFNETEKTFVTSVSTISNKTIFLSILIHPSRLSVFL